MLTYGVISEKSLLISRYLIIVTAIFAPISTGISSVASIGLLLTWMLSGQVLQTLKIAFRNTVGKTVLLFFIWLLISSLYADTDWSTKLTTLLSWKKLFFVFILLGLFYEQQWQRRFVNYYVIFMAIVALICLPLWAMKILVRGEREAGILMTNYVSQSMAFIAALVCCMFLAREEKNLRNKIYIWSVAVLFLLNILVISSARSGYIALIPAVVFAGSIIYGYKNLPKLLGIFAAILLVMLFSSSNLQHRVKLAVEEQSSYQTSSNLTSVGIRIIFYQNTWELIKQRPIFGYGTSSFERTYAALASSKYQDWRGKPTSDPHNQYLFIWLENGLVGLVIFLIYIYVSIKQGLHLRPYGPIASSFLVAVCVSSLFNSHFKTFPEGNLVAFFMGCLLAYPPTLINLNNADA